jgi:YbbR domain-containing protein
MNNKVINSIWSLRILSILVAIILWVYVIISEPIEVDRKVNIEFINPPGMALSQTINKELVLKLHGARAFLNHAFVNSQKIYIDLNQYPYRGQKNFNVEFSAKDFALPLGVNLIEVRPQSIAVSFQKISTKKVPVRLNLVGRLGIDFRLIGQEIEPSEVMIEGPEDIIKEVGEVSTLAVELSQIKNSESIKVYLHEVDDRVIIKDHDFINVNFKLKPTRANTTLKNLKIKFLSENGQYVSDTKTVAVSVLVPESNRLRILEKDVQIVAEIPARLNRSEKIKLKAILPNDVVLVKIHPEMIIVKPKR